MTAVVAAAVVKMAPAVANALNEIIVPADCKNANALPAATLPMPDMTPAATLPAATPAVVKPRSGIAVTVAQATAAVVKVAVK